MSFLNLGNVRVIETKDYISVSGIRFSHLQSDLGKKWNTSLANYLLTGSSFFEFKLRKFFLLDFIFVVEKLLVPDHKDKRWYNVPRRKLNQLLDGLKSTPFYQRVVGGYTSKIDESKLKLFNTEPLSWQRNYLDVYDESIQKYQLKGHLLAAEAGTGKTIGSMMLAECMGADNIVVLCLKSTAIDTWVTTFEKYYKDKPKVWCSVYNQPLDDNINKFVVHYEYLPKFLDFLRRNNKKLSNMFVIVDECHHFNEINSNRTQSLIQLCNEYAKYSLWMSGTPIKAMGKEVIPLLRCIDPLFDSKTSDIFKKIYGVNETKSVDILSNRIGYVTHQVSKGSIMQGKELVFHKAYVRLKDGDQYTLVAIREKIKDYVAERVSYYKETESHWKDKFLAAIELYRKRNTHNNNALIKLQEYQNNVEQIRSHGGRIRVVKDQIASCKRFEEKELRPMLSGHDLKDFRKASSVYKYVNLTILGEALGNVLGKARAECISKISTNLDQISIRMVSHDVSRYPHLDLSHLNNIKHLINGVDKKTIMFSSYVKVIKDTGDYLKSLGFQTELVYGETSNDLVNILSRYNTEDDVNPLVATFQSLGTGIHMVAANLIVMLNVPFREYIYEQAYSRAYRKGQDKDVHVVDVYLDTNGVPNITTHSKEIMDKTSKMVARLLGVDITSLELTGAYPSNESCKSCYTTNENSDSISIKQHYYDDENYPYIVKSNSKYSSRVSDTEGRFGFVDECDDSSRYYPNKRSITLDELAEMIDGEGRFNLLDTAGINYTSLNDGDTIHYKTTPDDFQW